MNEFQIEVLRQVVGHCSHNIGWNGIHASSLDLLTEVLQKYLTEIGHSLHRYSEQFGRTGPNLDDLGLVFRDMGISIPDLTDYVCNVEPSPFNEDVSKIPIPREHALNFLKPGSHEVLSRPVHIHEHLPPMQHIILGEDKVSGDETEITENLSMVVQECAEQNTSLSPQSYSFKRPDGAEKRKGGWLGDDGQPIREISSVMMTTSGYLSSSREGKLPETKIRKIFLETELDHFSSSEKKINMKKVFEGIKKADDSSRKCDEKDSDLVKKFNEIIKDRDVENEEGKKSQIEQTKEMDVEKEGKKERSKDKERIKELEKEKEREVEKEREKEKADKEKIIAKDQEKEKTKKKRNKEKLLEEFAFFEKEKSTSFKPSESTTPVDSTKQKLNIFKKLSKTKDMDNQALRIALPPTHRVFPETNESEKGSTISFDEGAFKGFSDTTLLSSNSEAFSNEKQMSSKKERKIKNKKDRHGFVPEVSVVDGSNKGRQGADFFKGDSAGSKEESIVQSDSTSSGKSSQNKLKLMAGHGVDLPKKKRGRPSRMMTPELGETQISEAVPTVHAESPIPAIPKSFFPFSPHFPVPGLIPQPFIPNVPFNLLGVPPLGLRSPLGISSSNMLASVGPVATNTSPSDFCTTPKGDSTNKVPPLPSPTTKSPNIVDSLPESLNVDTSEGDTSVSKKKEKRDKKEKEKKRKEKKIKAKVSDEQEKKAKREKKKEKKDKEKDKDKSKEKEEITVPKITFKFAAAPMPTSPNPAAPESTPKLIFKAMAGREGNFTTAGSGNRDIISHSPVQPSVEVAKFSALVTRPPKLVKSVKETSANKLCSEIPSESPSNSQTVQGPPRTPSPSSKVRREKPQKPPRVTKEKEKEKKKCDKLGVGDVAVITETVGSYYDEFGNKIWICPACGRQDDGTPMIGCDECDDWYHWVCVGIRVPPAETESWFCQRCIAKKQGSLKDKKKGRKKKSV